MAKVVTQEEVISVCRSKNCSPVDIYIDGHREMKFYCLIHNKDYVSTYRLIASKQHNSNKCPLCSRDKQQKKNDACRLSNEEIDKRVKLIHSDRIERVEDVKGRHTKIKWKCNICGFLWMQEPGNVVNEKFPTGCSRCSKNTKDTCESFSQKLKNLGRNDLKLIGNYINSTTKTKFKCLRCEAEWESKPANILNNGRGCPLCINKSEKVVGDILKKCITSETIHNYYVKTEDRKYLIDWYIPKLKLAVEYNGIQHYKPTIFGKMSREVSEINFKNQIIRDNDLRKWCLENKIKLIEIDGREYKYKNTEKLNTYIINTLQENGFYVQTHNGGCGT